MKVVGDERDDAVEYRMTRTRQVEAEALGGNEEKQEPGQQAPRASSRAWIDLRSPGIIPAHRRLQ
ncbi:hypothetical protein Q1M63_12645 (plasmid) [Sinorhizobium meliloti]|nr:hypothetical protein Q1M63_12645 [Sinorhizobium meliloti]